MSSEPPRLAPAFYAARGADRRRWMDWYVVLHPPYTLWHLSYVAIGACIAPTFDGGRLAATLLAFALAVGISAHALDELHGRPLRTAIPSGVLVAAAAASLTGAVAIGIVGIARVGAGLAVFIVLGAVLTVGYNLELFGGRLHNDVVFAAAWGAFPVLTAYYAQAETLRLPAVVAAAGTYAVTAAQRSLSTPARSLRRNVASVDGTINYLDGRHEPLSTATLLTPLEAALKAMAFGLVALAVALTVFRLVDQ